LPPKPTEIFKVPLFFRINIPNGSFQYLSLLAACGCAQRDGDEAQGILLPSGEDTDYIDKVACTYFLYCPLEAVFGLAGNMDCRNMAAWRLATTQKYFDIIDHFCKPSIRYFPDKITLINL
jgi:hypothetical protein